MSFVKWDDIKDQFLGGDILIGNGVSISMSEKFRYSSIYRAGQNLLSDDAKKIFDSFKSNDFEWILHHIANARKINELLDVECCELIKAYDEIKDSLIQILVQYHASYDEVYDGLKGLGIFLSDFKTVLNLNYDFLVYWAMLIYNHEQNGGKNHFKDGFKKGRFDYKKNKERYLTPHGNSKGVTMVFYPHGNLCLVNDEFNEALKISRKENSGNSIKELIQDEWMESSPLFISEGDSEQKEGKICCNDYLRYIFDHILTVDREKLVVLGSSLESKDEHIFNRIYEFSSIKRIAVSYHTPLKRDQYLSLIKKYFPDIKDENIYLFHYDTKELFGF